MGAWIGAAFLALVLLAVAWFVLCDRRSRRLPAAEQEAQVAEAFQRREIGVRVAETGIALSRVSLPVERIKEIAAENGYEYSGVRHNRMGEFLVFRLTKGHG